MSYLMPGIFVRNPARPEWGLGQVQPVVGERVTVTFESAGKVVIDLDHVPLEPPHPDDSGGGRV